MNSTVHDLVGAWRLERRSLEYDDGRQSFIPKVIDHMMRVPDEAALAAMRLEGGGSLDAS